MDLPTIWFVIVGYLFAGFFFLEGFDYGVGILSPFLSKNEEHRRMMLSSIGGVWDGNEVWMVSAGAILFASFPAWYATLFSSLYTVFVLILVALILRGVGIKFRNQRQDPLWRSQWDWTICVGSLVGALLWGMVVGNLLAGIPINEQMVFVGSFKDVVTPFSLITAIALMLLFVLHGATFLSVKISGEALQKVLSALWFVYVPALLMAAVFLAAGFLQADMLRTWPQWVLAGSAVVTLAACGVMIFLKKNLGAFWLSGATIVLVTALAFVHLYPRVLISSLDPAWSLTISNASSSTYSLQVMSVAALMFIPLVALYQGWTYWVLRKRIEKSDLGY